ncbi:MAG: hypothetical protein N2440_04435 [Actinobacteria bacterium]|nr:hypothetical protein [Actinomycetota bacterium]
MGKIIQSYSRTSLGVKSLSKRSFLFLVAVFVLIAASTALAADIKPKVYNKQSQHSDFSYYSNGQDRGYDFSGFTTSTHIYGTWNNPYKAGIDAYNYNDAQGYTQLGQGGVLFVWGESILPMLQQMGYSSEQAKMYFPLSLQAGTKFSYTDPNKATMQNVGQGPHGGYTTTTHKCRECHAVHRASGKFKLLRADSRVEACDWCHGQGAGSGYNIQMDNDDSLTQEYNVGHTLGFGNKDGDYKAPDDTYPAYTPKYYMGGFSCIDCHSPHGNPQRLLGFMDQGRMFNPQANLPFSRGDNGNSVFYKLGVQVSGFISNPGENDENTEMMRVPWPLNVRRPAYEVTMTIDLGMGPMQVAVFNVWQAAADGVSWLARRPIVPGGRYLLIENPDVEIVNGQEIPDYSLAKVNFPGDGNQYPVNKSATSWDFPYGTVSEDDLLGDNVGNFVNPLCAAVTISQFCQDCHDGNAGLHTQPTPLFSEDRAARGEKGASAYDIGYGHDTNPRHCGRQMKFNPEDANAESGTGNFGPHCRNCHRGASSCDRCHENGLIGTTDTALAAYNVEENYPEFVSSTFGSNASTFPASWPLYGGLSNIGFPAGFPISWLEAFGFDGAHYNKTTHIRTANERWYHERTVAWASDWRTNATQLSPMCSDDGFSFPHRTMGYMMLKDELFGLDFDGTPVGVGQIRDGIPSTILSDGSTTQVATSTLPSQLYQKPAQDLDSVCLDCHNPTIWNATSYDNHFDSWSRSDDNYNDELLLRGLP